MATASTINSIAMPAMAAGLRKNMRSASMPGCSTRTGGLAAGWEAEATGGIAMTLLMRP